MFGRVELLLIYVFTHRNGYTFQTKAFQRARRLSLRLRFFSFFSPTYIQALSNVASIAKKKNNVHF